MLKMLGLFCLVTVASISQSAEAPANPIAQKGDVILADDFERSDLGAWKPLIGTFVVESGVLKGYQTRADHGAVGRFYHPMRDVVVSFRYKLAGSTGFNAVFDDQTHKGSHAGHICRVAFAPKQIRIADDKEGTMRNDIYELKKDPARKAEADKLLVGRSATVKLAPDPAAWHDVEIEIKGDRLRLSVDGKPVGYLQSSGIAHETKSSFHFTVNGPGVLFDDGRIWAAK